MSAHATAMDLPGGGVARRGSPRRLFDLRRRLGFGGGGSAFGAFTGFVGGHVVVAVGAVALKRTSYASPEHHSNRSPDQCKRQPQWDC